MSIRRSDYVEDFKWVPTAIVVIWVLAAFVLFLVCICDNNINDNYTSYQTYSEFAEKANENFSPDQRKILVEIMPEYEEDLGEDGVFAEREAPSVSSFAQLVQENKKTILLIFVLVSAVLSTLFYFFAHSDSYYLADLPLKSFHGWFVLITSFIVAWPFLIVSRILFWRFRRGQHMVSLPEIEPEFNEGEFIAFCQSRMPLNKRIETARQELEDSKQRVSAYGEDVKKYVELLKDAQSEVSQKQADLNDLINKAENPIVDTRETEQFAHDFAEIKAMRGVKKIFTDTAGNLVVVVRVLYKYDRFLYDIGDFEIIIDDKSVEVHRTRSSTANYHYGRRFCFGENTDAIVDYVSENRLVEAVELVIESINHINKSDLGSIPQYYKIVKNIRD